MSCISNDASRTAATRLVDFVNKSPTPFHVVKTVSDMLLNAGFTKLEEGKVWPALVPGGMYFMTRNESSIAAFALGGKFKVENGIKIVGAHTDSPNLALKPRTGIRRNSYEGVAVQLYGGGLWHTWFDRDLTVAGRVTITGKPLQTRLVKVNKPLMRIPSLAIHLRTAEERSSFRFNTESHLVPLIAMQVNGKSESKGTALPEDSGLGNNDNGHSVPLMKAVADAAGCQPEDIVDFDLSVVDFQDATIGGAMDEYIYAPRLDNQISCYCGVQALIDSKTTLASETMMRMVCMFDHEEVGSSSAQGAGGSMVVDIIEHLVSEKTLRATLVANSFFLSVDGAHAVHPSYPEKHESSHRPQINRGVVMKYNASVRYITNGLSAGFVRQLAKLASVPLQEFVVSNDACSGSTIGPILSTLTGIRGADVGNPMLSMHSIREMCGTEDVHYLSSLIGSLFENDIAY